jgi:hypothetical protein
MLHVIMLNVIVLNVVILNGIMLNVVMLIFVLPSGVKCTDSNQIKGLNPDTSW